jgi:hypothetical protein
VGNLITQFPSDKYDLATKKEIIIHHITGWDVLRPEDAQGSTAPLTAKMLNSLDLVCVQAIFKSKFPKLVTLVKSKKNMIEQLCPAEEASEEEVTSKRKKYRVDSEQLTACLMELRGTAENKHRVYDLFNTYHASIDEMDKRFYAHFRTRYLRGITHAGLSHIASYIYATTYAISAEYARAKIHTQTSGNNRATYNYQHIPINTFLCNLVTSFKQQYPSKHK